MQAVIDWVNNNAGILNLLIAAMVAVATVVTTWLNQRLVRETASLRQAETDPDIALDIEPRRFQSSFFDVVIRNVGRGPAYNLSFVLDKYWAGRPGSPFYEMALFRDGLTYLAPDQELRSFVGTYRDLDHGQLTITVTYFGKAGTKQTFMERFTIDVGQFEGTLEVGAPPERKATRALERIADDLHRLRGGRAAFKVRVDGLRLLPEKRWPVRRREPRYQRLLRLHQKMRAMLRHHLPRLPPEKHQPLDRERVRRGGAEGRDSGASGGTGTP